jgi:SAM-dependent methyltransferase
MADAKTLHDEQVAYWTGVGAEHWLARQARNDVMLAPVADAAIAAAAVTAGETVLDVGCGCGPTSVGLARRVGPKGRVVALDVSPLLIERARQLHAGGANIEWALADAATHAAPGPIFDLIFSRFGVMFFGDPAAAFANLRHGLKPGGRLLFACWRKPAENPWMMVPLHEAYKFVPRLPKLGPEDPGPFSFADPERVTRILTAAGFAAPRFTPLDVSLDLAGGAGLDAAVALSIETGPTSRAFEGQPEAARKSAIGAIREALAEHLKDGRVALAGAVWLVAAASA